MKSIKELAPKPSDAIQAMIDGLKEIPNGDFKIDMGTYSNYEFVTNGKTKVVCFGCAATCAVLKLTKTKLSSFDPVTLDMWANHGRETIFKFDDLFLFEVAIDKLRRGYPETLGEFYGISDHMFAGDKYWYINDDNYLERLPFVQEYCNELKELGY